MTSFYGSNSYKQAGIQKQGAILEKIVKYLTSQGFVVEGKPSTLSEDMTDKFDYRLIFDKRTPFLNSTLIKVDVKFGTTYTLYDQNGNNTLEKSKSDYIIYNFPKRQNELLFVNTQVLKSCLKKYLPSLKTSLEKGNDSKYFFIESYIREHCDVFSGNTKYVNV